MKLAEVDILIVPGLSNSGAGHWQRRWADRMATARIVDHLPRRPLRWLVTGGGRLNLTFMRLFEARLGVPVEPVETVGWQGDALEAQCFGYLAVRSLRGLPLSLPTTTGVPAPQTGGDHWSPAGR